MPSFKVACPSCEAEVLIKDQKLVGTKTECPKCKYRFKVEEPTGGLAEDDSKANKNKKAANVPEVSDAAKKKKQKKLMAMGVGVVAVAVLAIVGVVIATTGSDNKPTPPIANPGPGGPIAKSGPTGPGPGATGPGAVANKDGKENKNSKDEGKKDSSKDIVTFSVIPKSERESTNLLPSDTVSVFRFDLDKLRQTPLNRLFDGLMAGMFKDSFGFDPESVGVYYHTFVGNTREPFGVMQLKVPVSEKDILARMALAEENKKIRGRTIYAFKANPFINAVANTCSFSSLFGQLFAKSPPAPIASPESRIIGVCYYDSQHLLVGDFALLGRYLNELETTGYPKFQSALKPQAGSSQVQAKRALYLSINPQLKLLLESLDSETLSPPAVLYAEKVVQGLYDPKFFKQQYQPLAAILDPILNRLVYMGGNVVQLSTKEMLGTLKLRMASASEALEIAKTQLAPGLTLATEGLNLFVKSQVDFVNKLPGAQPTQTQPGGPGMGPGMGPGSGPGSGPMFGPGSPPKSSQGPMSPSFPPAGPGSGKMSPPSPPGPGGMRPPGSPGGTSPSYPPSGINPPGVSPQPPKSSSQSHIDLAIADQEITITVDLRWTQESYNVVSPLLITYLDSLKGKIAVYASDEPFHALSMAIPKMNAQTREFNFPRGTFDRQVADVSRRGLKYPPDTRVSFFAELLPFMGRGSLRTMIDTDKAWFDPENLPAAESWVPEFLIPTYPQSSWRATSPHVPGGRTLGGTNYVAIAGIGVDAARLDPNNPADAKKMGLVGYEWGSKVSDVTDGLSNTIYMMETPPGLSQPWIQGGGATVRGLNETDPMKGFRHMNPNGQVGTYALMGDGTVRFIKGNIDPKVLLAMGTRAGGEMLAEVLDTEAPLVNPPKQAQPRPVAPPAPPTVKESPAPAKGTKEPPAPSQEPPAPVKPPAPDLPQLEIAPPPRTRGN